MECIDRWGGEKIGQEVIFRRKFLFVRRWICRLFFSSYRFFFFLSSRSVRLTGTQGGWVSQQIINVFVSLWSFLSSSLSPEEKSAVGLERGGMDASLFSHVQTVGGYGSILIARLTNRLTRVSLFLSFLHAGSEIPSIIFTARTTSEAIAKVSILTVSPLVASKLSGSMMHSMSCGSSAHKH